MTYLETFYVSCPIVLVTSMYVILVMSRFMAHQVSV
jgi:hypothetical protein